MCVSPLRSAALAAAAAYAALAGLVAAGTFTGLDQWAVDNAMPGARGVGAPPTFLESLVPLLHSHYPNGIAIAEQIVTLPGQVVVSFVLVAAVATVVRRRGRPAATALWLGAWLLGTAIEVLCKHVLARPALTRDGLHIVAFDSSWPSGHTIRCAIVAATLAAAWPRARPLLAVWLAAALGLLELAGAHTPTDIAGGLLLVGVLVPAGVELGGSALLGGGAAFRTRGSGRGPRRA